MKYLYDKDGDLQAIIPETDFELDTSSQSGGCADIPWKGMAQMPFLDLQWTLINAFAMGLFLCIISPLLSVFFCLVKLHSWVKK